MLTNEYIASELYKIKQHEAMTAARNRTLAEEIFKLKQRGGLRRRRKQEQE